MRPTRAQAAVAIVVATAAALLCVDRGDASSMSVHCREGCRVLVGPVMLHGGYVQLERHDGSGSSSVPRLRLVSRGGRGFNDNDIRLLLDTFTVVLRRKRPFIIIWDARKLAWPRISGKQVGMLHAWFEKEYLNWDTYLQAHATIISNPLARAFASLVTGVFRPPQPINHHSTPEQADAFARRCCDVTRSYVKKPEEYAAAPGWKHFRF
jgi:hypothetical protein